MAGCETSTSVGGGGAAAAAAGTAAAAAAGGGGDGAGGGGGGGRARGGASSLVRSKSLESINMLAQEGRSSAAMEARRLEELFYFIPCVLPVREALLWRVSGGGCFVSSPV